MDELHTAKHPVFERSRQQVVEQENQETFWLFVLSYMLVDNFQRGIFKWPLVFGWSTLPDKYIKKHNMTISDPIR